jgi:hypothetical protein
MSAADNAFTLAVRHGSDLWRTVIVEAPMPDGVDPRDPECSLRCWFVNPNAFARDAVAMFDTADGSNGLTIDDYDAPTRLLTLTFSLSAARMLQIPLGDYLGTLLLDRATNDPTRPTDRRVIATGKLVVEWGSTQ